MEEVISILLSDSTLLSLTGNMIKPFGQLPLGKGLTYEFSENSSNGIKAQDRLSITAVSYSITDSLQILRRAKKLILTLGDAPLTQRILKVVQSGGGSISNVVDGKTMYHFTTIFYITRREV